jgi:regulator of protease activity HflC (stomatin/prohibitin superfamily)
MSMFWVGVAVVGSAVVVAGTSVYTGEKQANAIKKAQGAAEDRNNRALAEAKAAQETAAEQAQNQIENKRRLIAGSKTIFTSPMGLADQSTMTKKTLLGA